MEDETKTDSGKSLLDQWCELIPKRPTPKKAHLIVSLSRPKDREPIAWTRCGLPHDGWKVSLLRPVPPDMAVRKCGRCVAYLAERRALSLSLTLSRAEALALDDMIEFAISGCSEESEHGRSAAARVRAAIDRARRRADEKEGDADGD